MRLHRLLILSLTIILWIRISLAINYVGGWVPSSHKTKCVDICVNSSSEPTCFSESSIECKKKKQVPGDYDYLLLDQIYIPQYCRDLDLGYDTTVSHQNVLPYPNGIHCQDNRAKNELTIHGLWPNYIGGYPACCNISKSQLNHPFNALSFSNQYPKLLEDMSKNWVDPTQPTTYDSLCEIYNHEFQKHGICFMEENTTLTYNEMAHSYFESVLRVASLIKNATNSIEQIASSQQSQQTSIESIEKLYTHKVQVYCSSVDRIPNQLSSIRTCWIKKGLSIFEQIDCPKASSYGPLVTCDNTVSIRLHPYQSPWYIKKSIQ